MSPKDYERAIRLSEMLVSSDSLKKEAIRELQALVAPPPKRPVYHAQDELASLPKSTRGGIKYLGDYVDILTKHVVYEHVLNPPKSRPLGVNIQILAAANILPPQLLEWLEAYNSCLYVPAKHDFELPLGRTHRFSSQEVVFSAFITMRLATLLREYSHCSTELNCNHLKCRLPLKVASI